MNPEDLYKDLDIDTKKQLAGIARDIKATCKNKDGTSILDESGKEIPTCNIILFLGAAVHYAPPKGFEECYPAEQSPPQVGKLIDLMIDEMIAPFDDELSKENEKWKKANWPLSWISQYYEDANSRLNLLDKLSLWINNNKKPSPLVKALAEMPFRYIVTTNYDCLFEDALSLAGKPNFHKGIYKANKIGKRLSTDNVDKTKISHLTPFIYKLHGDIRDIEKDKDAKELKDRFDLQKDSIVLTDEDYIHFILRMSEKRDNIEKLLSIPNSDKNNIGNTSDISKNNFDDPNFDLYPIPKSIFEAFCGIENKTFLFIGYGMRDYNLRLIFKSSMWGNTEINIANQLKKWSVAKTAEDPIKRIFEKNYNFTFIERDAWSVIPYLYRLIFNKEMPL